MDNKKGIKFYILSLMPGMLLSLFAYLLSFYHIKSGISIYGFVYLHHLSPVFYFVDLLPFITFLFSLFYNLRFEKQKDLLKYEIDEKRLFQNDIHKYLLLMLSDNNHFKLADHNKNKNVFENIKQLNEKLITLTNQLDEVKTNEKKYVWINDGINDINGIIYSSSDNIEDWSFRIINKLVTYCNANQAAAFSIESMADKKYFKMLSCYAYERRKFADKEIPWGKGLIGSVALEKKFLYLDEIPDKYIEITSGLGHATPNYLLIVPLICNQEVYGIVELASFSPIDNFKINFITRVCEQMASILSVNLNNKNVFRLLNESQAKNKQLIEQETKHFQQIEMLKTMQTMAASQSEEFISFTNSVNHTLIRAEYKPDGTLIYANTKFINKLGYKGNMDVEGKHITMFINNRDREWFNPLWNNLSKGGKHFEGYMKHVTKTGEDLWTISTYTCIRKEDGSVGRVLFLAIDSTEHKKTSLDYESQLAALNRSSIKAEISTDGKIIHCNNLFIAETDFPSDKELVGKDIQELISQEDIRELQIYWKEILNGRPFSFSFRINKSNSISWVRGTFTAVTDMYGELSKVILIAHNISKEKLIELESEKQRQQLKQQEEKLRLSGNELRKRLEETKEGMRESFKKTEKLKLRHERTLEGALDAIITINQQCTIEFFNEAASEMFKLEKNAAIGTSVSILFDEKDIEKHEFLKRLTDPSQQKIIGKRIEVPILVRDGKKNNVLILLSEAMVDDEYTITAFIQYIQVELF